MRKWRKTVADLAEAEWASAHPDALVVRRHLGVDPLPADAWRLATIAAFLPEDDRTPAQVEATVLANTLLAEVQSADAAILAVPLYNYGVSQHFKAWIYLIIAVAGPTAPALEGKPTVFVTTSGGGYGPGTPRQGWDHSTGYLERILRDFGRADLIVIKHGLTLAGVKPEMDGLRDLADQQHLAAQDAARKAGRVLAGS